MLFKVHQVEFIRIPGQDSHHNKSLNKQRFFSLKKIGRTIYLFSFFAISSFIKIKLQLTKYNPGKQQMVTSPAQQFEMFQLTESREIQEESVITIFQSYVSQLSGSSTILVSQIPQLDRKLIPEANLTVTGPCDTKL